MPPAVSVNYIARCGVVTGATKEKKLKGVLEKTVEGLNTAFPDWTRLGTASSCTRLFKNYSYSSNRAHFSHRRVLIRHDRTPPVTTAQSAKTQRSRRRLGADGRTGPNLGSTPARTRREDTHRCVWPRTDDGVSFISSLSPLSSCVSWCVTDFRVNVRRKKTREK